MANVAVAPKGPPMTPMTGGGNKVLVAEVGLSEFFADEDAEIRAATTMWLRANTPWDLVPADQVELVRARAITGKNLTTGAITGPPIHSHEGYSRAFGNHDAADVRVICAGTCTLEVSVLRHPPGAKAEAFSLEGTEFRFRAAVASPPTKEAVLRAISGLKREAPKDEETGGSVLAAIAHGRPPSARPSVTLSVWSSLTTDVFASVQREIDGCYRPGGSQEMYLLSVNDAGRVDRCEERPWSVAPSRDCLCAALKKVQLSKTAAGKRAAFDIVHDP